MATNRCELFNNANELSKYSSTWQWQDNYLGCNQQQSKTFTATKNTYSAKNLMVIRGHESEINTEKFQILTQAHGYHLVLKPTNFNASDFSSENHLEFITLEKYQSISKPNIKSIKPGASNTTQLVDSVAVERWRDDIVTLSSWSRRTGEAGNVSAANWIEVQLNDLGYQVNQQPFSVGSSPSNNIIGIKTGTTRPNDWYLIGAHMDSIPSGNAPGAVDNASGCAAVLELATVASTYQFEGTLIFICFSGEEQGLIGSEFHATSLVNLNDDEKIKLALTLDMVGYTSNADHELLLESSSTHLPLMNEMAQLAATYAPNLTVYTSTNYFGSDHVSYIDNGMPGILSIDDDWNVYPEYHQSTDLPENINLTQGEYILKTNIAMLAEKAGIMVDTDLIFINGFDQST